MHIFKIFGIYDVSKDTFTGALICESKNDEIKDIAEIENIFNICFSSK